MSIDSSSSTFIQRLGRERLQVISKLGGGASGTVFRARDRETRRLCALKVLRDATPQRVERFRREAEVAASLVHPSIVPVISAGVFEGHFFIAYELIEGARTLDQALPGLELRARVEALRDVARALGHAHALGVVHRDVKPANILVAADGRVLLTDFGLAAAEGQERMTRTGAIVGTPHYMAPEQINGRGAAPTPATDVWALGVLLYETLTGRLPFNAESLLELATQILTAAPERPSLVRPDASRGLEAVCLRALDADPSRRPANGEAFAADLEAWLTGSTMSAARPRARLPRPRTAVLALMLLGSGAALLAAAGYDPTPARQVVATSDPVAPVTVAPVPTATPPATPPEPPEDPPPWERAEEGDTEIITAMRADARAGLPDALYLLGGMYDSGKGLRRDGVAALRCFKESARLGNVHANYSVGDMLLFGQEGRPADPAAALPFLVAAAERGHEGAMLKLGRALQGNYGAPEDLPQARRWLERACEEGTSKEALFELALLLARGEGGPADRPRAVTLLQAAADQNHLLAMRAFGRVLLDGRDAPRDLEGGARWVERAVERGSSSAKLLYAELLATGRGVPAEPERARRLWFEAAEHIRDAAPREPAFMVLLARVFLASRWTVPDPAASREWLERAAARGSRDARRILARGWDEWDE